MSLKTRWIIFKMRYLAKKMVIRHHLTDTLPTKLFGAYVTEFQEVGRAVKLERQGTELLFVPVDRYRYRPKRRQHVLETNGMWICRNPLPNMYAGAVAGRTADAAYEAMVDLPDLTAKLESLVGRLHDNAAKMRKEQESGNR